MSVKNVQVASALTITPLTEDHLENPKYTPGNLLDAMLDRFGLKNDAALSRTLELAPAVISKIRHKHAAITPGILVRMHDITGWAIGDMRAQMGVKSAVKAL